MNKRPLLLSVLSGVFVMLALSFPVQVMLIYGHGFGEMDAVFAKLSSLNWTVMAGLLVCAVMLWRALPYTIIAIPLLIGLVALNNLVVGHYGTDFSAGTTALASVGFAFLNLPLMHAELRALFKNPAKRWWLRAERKRLIVPVLIEGMHLDGIRAQTFDFSETGVFVQNESQTGIGDMITLRFKFGTLHQFRCQGRVVRRSTPKGIYPAGVGIEFTNLSRMQKRELRRHLDRNLDL